jgi:acyl transferase domain-containing protein
MTDVMDTDIAIVGMAGRFPGARSVAEFWRNLREGVESVVPLSDEQLRAAGVSEKMIAHPDYVKVGAPLPDMEMFDGGFFGFNQRESDILDPQHRQFLEVAWEALEHAGHPPSTFKGNIALYAGSGHNAYMPYNLLTNPKLVDSVGMFLLRHTGNDKDFLTTRVSYLLDLRGPSLNIQTACSTSLVAVHLGCQTLLNGESDMVLAGGVTVEMPHGHGYQYQDGEILSPDGHCRPFDAQSAGTVFGSGVGIVVLRRLTDAMKDGDTIYAVIKGSAINNDGLQKVGYLAPSVEGQARAIAEAMAVGGVTADSISYVEAHGTGTPVGDPIEIAALTQAYRQDTDKVGYAGIGSVKSNIGHTDTAAGVASLIKVVQALNHEELPATLHFTGNNPSCSFETSPFRVQSTRTAWPRTSTPRRAAVSSLGVGGTNAHVVVQEPPVAVPSRTNREWQLFPFSAKTADALNKAGENLAKHFAEQAKLSLVDAAWTLQVGRTPMVQRRFVVARDAASASKLFAESTQTPAVAATDRRNVAFMFAGGGAQYPGMGRELYESEPVFKEAVDRGMALLEPALAQQLLPLLRPPAGADLAAAAAALERPSLALPALLLIQYATAQLWKSWGIEPTAMIGHSMGEYTAAHLAGVFDLRDALHLVALRGRLFEKIPEGGMLGVSLPESELRKYLGTELSIAAVNAPGLSVASGPVPAIERLQKELEAKEIDSTRIRINVAAHSMMLEPILAEFGAFLQKLQLRAPTMPFVSNVTGQWITDAEATDPQYWVKHLRQTVRFADGLGVILEDQGRLLLEVGPGRTLASLSRQHSSRKPHQVAATSLRHPGEEGADQMMMLSGLGRLWQYGLDVDWQKVHGTVTPHRIALPTYAFAKERHWIEPGKVAVATGATDATGAELSREPDLAKWFYEPEWRRVPRPAASVKLSRVVLFADQGGLAENIAKELRATGAVTTLVRAGSALSGDMATGWTINPTDAAHYEAVLKGMVDAGGAPDAVVHCWAVDDSSTVTLPVVADRTFYSLLHLAQAVGGLDIESPMRLLAVSTGLQDVAGETTVDARKAMLLGPLRVFPREFPNVWARSVDVSASAVKNAALAPALVEELSADSTDYADSIALRGSDRWAERFEMSPRGEASKPKLKNGGRYIVTGGLGGIGLTLAQHLASHHKAKLVLAARTALPARDGWDRYLADHPSGDATSARINAVRKLERAGAEVVVVAADVSDTAQAAKLVATATERFGGVDGVFHAAGTLDDHVMALKERDSAWKVLQPKVAGSIALADALAGKTVDFFALFSSISSFAGLTGQADYAAANAFLDAYARFLTRTRGLPTVSIGWSTWRDVGMAAELAKSLGFGTVDEIPANQPVVPPHPFLQQSGKGDGQQVFAARLSPEKHWLLGEHRVRQGDALIPGTGYLELARAAFERSAGVGPLELSEIGFQSPFAVANGAERDLQVRLTTANGNGTEFAVFGRGSASEAWEEHVRGTLRRISPAGKSIKPAEVLGRAVRKVTRAPDQPLSVHLDFGPRWDNIREIAYGKGEALITLALPDKFTGELDVLQLHPALLDMATAGAQELVDGFNVQTDFLVPLSYSKIEVHGPLTAKAFSHVRLAPSSTPEVAVFDVTIADASGKVLVEVEEFTMIRVRDRAQLGATRKARPSSEHHAAVANPLLDIGLKDGIRAAEGMEVLERILSGTISERSIVSPLPLMPVIHALRMPAVNAPAEKKGGGASAPPSRDLSAVSAVLRTHAAVADAEVADRRDQSGETRVVAWMAYKPGEQATGSELRKLLRSKVAADQVVHTFVEVDRIPRNGDAPDWTILKSPFGVEESTAAPETPTEQAIAEIWKELLGNDEVGRFDNFFDIGGHSLLAVRFISRLQRKLGARLLHEQIVVHTLSQLAAKVDEMSAATPAAS